MAALVFVLFWVGMALALLFVAMRRNPIAPRPETTGGGRGRGLSYALFALTLVLFGLVIPGAVVAAIESRDSDPDANIANLSAREERGRELFGRYCKHCHTLKAGAGVATVGPNLDQLRPTKGLILDAIENGRARGNGAMAPDLVEGADADAVATFVAKAVGQEGK